MTAATALEPPTGIIAIPSGDVEQPCGGAAIYIGNGQAITLDEALPQLKEGDRSFAVVLVGGRHRRAEVVKHGSATTSVLIRLIGDVPTDIVAMPFSATGAEPLVGDAAYSAGNSFGTIEFDGVCALSSGVVSGLYIIPADAPPVHGRYGRILSAYRGPVLETDAAINDGNQGGALLDAIGQVIGVVSLGCARERRLGTAIPIDRVIQDLQVTVNASTLPSAWPQRDESHQALIDAARAAAASVALVYLERTDGLGNPDSVLRPPRAVADAPAHEREKLQHWWDVYYHQQQMLYTDQAIPALVIDAEAGLLMTAASNLHGGQNSGQNSGEHSDRNPFNPVERGRVLIPGAASIPCRVLALHRPLDVVLLKSDRPLPLPAAALARNPHVAIGDPLAVVGRHQQDGGFTVTTGVVSATGRKRQRTDGTVCQTDARANYGSLGGAVVNPAGAVIGMTVMMGPDDEWPWFINSGVSLFVDSATLLRVLPELRQGRNASYVGLGIKLKSDSDPLQIEAVIPGTGAAVAGLLPHDEVETVDGLRIDNYQDFVRALAGHGAGNHVELGVRRDGHLLTIVVEIRTMPE